MIPNVSVLWLIETDPERDIPLCDFYMPYNLRGQFPVHHHLKYIHTSVH